MHHICVVDSTVDVWAIQIILKHEVFEAKEKSIYNRAFKNTNQDIGFELLKLVYNNPWTSI